MNLLDLSLCDSVFYLLKLQSFEFSNNMAPRENDFFLMAHMPILHALVFLWRSGGPAILKTNIIKDLSLFSSKCLHRKTSYAKKILHSMDKET